jgi:CobQ-like glutamine amidotransferase family enzyme
MTAVREPRRLKIAHLYPDAMDLYGDIGNVIALKRRCEWRGIGVDILDVCVGAEADLSGVDLFVMGGGQDAAQMRVAEDLGRRGPAIREAVEMGAAALAVCGGFQLFGASYATSAGEIMPGIEVFDAHTVGGPERVIGNITVEARLRRFGAAHQQAPVRLVGFENHSGRTTLAETAEPLGRILESSSDSHGASFEGAVYKNAIGTYLHGPLLPKNPRLADHLIIAALAYRYEVAEPLLPLDDTLESSAHRVALGRCGRAGV